VLALPVTHVAGLTVLVRSLVARTRPEVVDLYGGFGVEAFAAATARLAPGVRHYTSLVPTQLRRLIDAGVDLTTYDGVLVGGAALSPDLRDRALAAGVPVVTTYGMSETCGGCVYDGEPFGGVDVVLGDDGRVSIGGPVVFVGYRLRPDLTARALVDGRHLTQDLGRWTADGRLEVLGRVDDVVVTGGVNVAAAMVERVLNGHPGVAVCAVVGVADPEWGQRVVAVVQPVDAAAPPTVEELRAFAAGRLDPAALPREVVTLGMLPVLASGKPDKAAVRSLVAAAP
jgi:O-succinylbenzoic acid--CoA ligase